MTLRNIFLERREKTRRVPDQFAFLQLEHDDGGKILDLSEGGLRFESFAPVREHNPIHFWFSLNLRERIEGWGELTWTDAARKSGGLRFLRFADGGHEQLREYLAARSPQPHVPAKVAAQESDQVAKFVSRARPQAATLFAADKEVPGASTALPAPAAAPSNGMSSGMLVPMERHLAAGRRQLINGLIIGACAGAIVVFSAFKIVQYVGTPRTAVKSTVGLPAQTAPGTGSPSTAQPAPSGAQADVFSIATQKKGAAQARASATPAAGTAKPERLSKTPLTPDQLWTMVQAGNSTAAAALAELYIKGDGVPQNCAQARVLLLVASEKRNAAAIKRLADLDKGGCPAN